MSLLNALKESTTYRPLPDGIHQMKLIKAEDATDINGTAYVRLTFAPIDKPDFVHTTALYKREKFDAVKVLAEQVADALGVDSVNTYDLLVNKLPGTVISMTKEHYSTTTATGVQHGINWILYAKEQPATDTDTTTVLQSRPRK